MNRLFAASLKMVVRDRQSVFWALAFPMIFLGVFRLFSFDSAPATSILVSTEGAPTPQQDVLIAALSDAEFLEVQTTTALDEAEAKEMLEDEDYDAVLLVSGVDGEQQARLLQAVSDPVGSSFVVAGVASIVDAVNASLTGVPPAISYVAENVEGDDVSFFEFLGPGIIGMGMMTFATISLAGSLSRYREEGVLRRIRATPLRPWKFFGSVVGAHLVVACVQVVVLAVVAQVLGANVLAGGVWFIVVAVFGTLIFLNIGVIIAGRVRGRGAVEGAANAVTMPMMFLSGSFFPTDSLPSVVQVAVEALPLTHMLRALRALVDGQGIVSLWPELLVMTLWVVGTFAVARVSFSLRDQ